jgi:sporulation protein YqfD
MKKFKIFKKSNILKKINLKNSVVLFVSGYNLERHLNYLCNKNIEFLTIEKIDAKNAKIEILPLYEKEVESFLKGKNFEIKKKKYNGFFKMQKFFFARFGILIGLFFAICFYIISSNYILNFEVMGNQTHSSEEIIAVLSEKGVKTFDAINKNSNEEIEQIILDNFNEVSMVSVVKKGMTIVINIKEKLLNDEHENVGNHSALIAKDDGIITEIELIQGTLLVKVGDFVRAGDELVSPYIIDSSGQRISIEPKANIFADVWLAGESVHYNVKNVVERTGNVITERKLIFLDKEIYTNKVDISFEKYEVEVVETYLSDDLLPVKYQVIHYYETQTHTVEQEFSEVEEVKILEAKNLAKLRMREGEEIKKENYVISSLLGKTVVSYSITVNRKIS